MIWHWFDIFMICTDIPNHRYKELLRDAEREKMWHESVRGRESGREIRLLRMWSERSEYEMRRWDGETDRETKSAIPTLSDLGCEYVDPRAGDTSLLFVPVFASSSKCICMLTNWSICARAGNRLLKNRRLIEYLKEATRSARLGTRSVLGAAGKFEIWIIFDIKQSKKCHHKTSTFAFLFLFNPPNITKPSICRTTSCKHDGNFSWC